MTIKEIAKLAGVSASTVSKIMNHKDSNIHPDTRSRVLKIVKEYNYTPYTSTVHSSNTKTFVLGVLAGFKLPAELIRGILDTANSSGYSVLFFDNLSSLEDELKSITVLCKNKIDGVIWSPVSEESLGQEHQFTKCGIPIQYILRPDSANSICLDWEAYGYQAACTLSDLHHTTPAILNCPDTPHFSDIVNGFKRCLFEHQIPFHEALLLPPDIPEAFTQVISEHVTGIVVPTCNRAVALYQYCQKMHYKVPEQLSILSFSEEDIPARDLFPISCLELPYKSFGSYAASALIDQCEKEERSSDPFSIPCTLTSSRSIDVPPTQKEPKILVVGSIHLDVTLNMEEIPRPGEIITIQNSSINPGGKGMNQAIGVAKLKHPVTLIGVVGNDYDASLIYASASEHNIDIKNIIRHGTSPTGKAYIGVQSDGESVISILPGANQHLNPEILETNMDAFTNTNYCLVSTEIPLDAAKKALQLAKKAGASTILKPSTMYTIDSDILKDVDFFIPNRKEAELLCPDLVTPAEKARFFLKLGAKHVIITLGHRGCILVTDEYEEEFPALPLAAINTTGAADAFIAALAVYLSKGYDTKTSIQISTCAAALSITKPGVIPALADHITLEKYLHMYMPDLLL